MLVTKSDVQAAYDEWQLYLYDAERAWDTDGQGEFLDALDDAQASGKSVGIAKGLVDLLMPRRDNFAVAVTVEHHDAAPADDADGWDHVVEFPLPLPSGRLVLAASGGGDEIEVRLPAGSYRGRWSGTGVQGAVDWTYDDDGNPPDAYRLQVWPEPDQQEPKELKRHPIAQPRVSGTRLVRGTHLDELDDAAVSLDAPEGEPADRRAAVAVDGRRREGDEIALASYDDRAGLRVEGGPASSAPCRCRRARRRRVVVRRRQAQRAMPLRAAQDRRSVLYDASSARTPQPAA